MTRTDWSILALTAAACFAGVLVFAAVAQAAPNPGSTLHLGTPCGTVGGMQPCRSAPVFRATIPASNITFVPSVTTSFSAANWPEPSLIIKGTGEIELFDCRRHVMVHVADVKVAKGSQAWAQHYRGFKFRRNATREQMERVALIFLGTLEKDYNAGKCAP